MGLSAVSVPIGRFVLAIEHRLRPYGRFDSDWTAFFTIAPDGVGQAFARSVAQIAMSFISVASYGGHTIRRQRE